jgi:Beta-propeller repeat
MKTHTPQTKTVTPSNLFSYPWVRLTLSCVAGVSLFGRVGHCEPAAATREAYGNLPLSFEANRGQTAPSAQFLARGAGYSLFLTGDGAVFVMSRRDKQAPRPLEPTKHRVTQEATNSALSRTTTRTALLRMNLVGANSISAAEGLDEQAGKANYFIGNDSAKWQANIPTFGRVQYKNVYSGIDLTYYGNQRQLEYDFIVAPKADYKQIELNFKNAKKVEIDRASGDLILHTQLGVMREHQPKVYQKANGARQEIAGRYVMCGHGRIGFEIGDYDATRPLVIDPSLVYSTYLGGSADDGGSGIAVDASGNVYVTGRTVSTNFPTKNPLQPSKGGGANGNVFITKLSADGQSLIYSTYLGGSGDDGGNSIAVDSSGNAYVTGGVFSTDFPTKNPVQATFGGGALGDAFVTKLSADGQSLVYSTYLGGSDGELGNGIAVDSSGNAYVTGYTESTNFPRKNPLQATYGGGSRDVFVTKFSADGQSLIYSTYLGGSGSEIGLGIAVDSSGSAYLIGTTDSTNFPTKNPFQANQSGSFDAFVTKLSADGQSLVYSTYLGGSDAETGSGIAVDSSGNAYVTGETLSPNFPTQNPLQANLGGSSDAFITELSPSGQSLIYSTYLGGSGREFGFSIAVGSSSNAYVTGQTTSTDFPTKNPFQPGSGGGNFDAFVTKLSADGQSLIYSTYFGGSDGDSGVGIAVDSSGNAYVTGYTFSTNFPTKNPFQASYGGGFEDGFIAKISDSSPTPPAAALLNISTRLRVLTNDNVLIGGFIVAGAEPKKVIVRGIGPSLPVGGALADPVLELHDANGTIATNDNWKVNAQTGQSQEAEVQATGIPPSNDLESVIIATLPANNSSYTAILRGSNGGTGIGLVEAYDLAQAANSKLANISTRGFVDTGDNVMIGGFITGPNTSGTSKVLVRAIGPSLPLSGALQDPTLELHDGSGTTIATNDNWKTRPDGTSQEAEIQATTIPPTNDLESAIVQMLAPGNYTAIVRGAGNTTGVALVEVYNLQ